MENGIVDDGALVPTFKAFRFTPVSVEVIGTPTYAEWELAVQRVQYLEGAVHWWVGDLLNIGDQVFGEMYAQAFDETRFSYGTLRNDKWVASRIPVSFRNDTMTHAHHVQVAKLEPQEQEYWLDRAEQEDWNVGELRQAIRKTTLPAPALPTGKYAVVYADPPWQYDNTGFDNAAESFYPTMPTDDICAMPVCELCTGQTVLFLWATNSLLPDAMRVMDAWGFTYKTNMAWVKESGAGWGWWLRARHELLLIGVRENTPHPQMRPDSCFFADRGPVHSRKPEDAYQIIESMFPGPRIELFARTTRPEWDAFGNEVSQ